MHLWAAPQAVSVACAERPPAHAFLLPSTRSASANMHPNHKGPNKRALFPTAAALHWTCSSHRLSAEMQAAPMQQRSDCIMQPAAPNSLTLTNTIACDSWWACQGSMCLRIAPTPMGCKIFAQDCVQPTSRYTFTRQSQQFQHTFNKCF
jgi:hypothetical protein